MAKKDEFDDEGFFDSLLNRKGNAELPPSLRRVFIVIAILVVASILIAVVVSSWPEGESADEAAVPIIRADTTPFKIKPENPGGMNVPNKDSTIFETLKGEKQEHKIENLLEDESDTAQSIAPQDIPEKVADAQPVMNEMPPQPVAPKSLETTMPVTDTEEADAPSIIDSLKADSRSETDEKVETVKPEPVKKAVSAKPAAATAPASGGSAYIQLAAVKSEAEASSQWAKFKSKNPELNSLSMRTQRADLGEKGVFYRIQAGPLAKEAALSTCAAIKSRGGSCIIAK